MNESYLNNKREVDMPKEIEVTITELLRAIEEQCYLNGEFGFDEQTIQEILTMEFAEALQTIYSYLTSAELDADTILADFFE